MEDRKSGLAPVCGESPEILILGSLPGDESIRRQQYYGNPRNMFWDVLGGVFSEQPPYDYLGRKDYLAKRRIALWDVFQSAEREGSLDSEIFKPEFNDISSLLLRHPSIRVIALNGGKAEKAFRQYCKGHELDLSNIRIIPLKSTSPLVVSAGWNLKRLISQWRSISEN